MTRSISPILVVLFFSFGLFGPVHGQVASVGFVRADQPTAARYTPDAAYTFNAAGAGGEVTRSAVGVYRVSFEGLGNVGEDQGNVQVTAYGGGSERCHAADWNGGDVDVVCFDVSGAAVDVPFGVLLLKPEAGTDGLAYARADQPTRVRYIPGALYTFNAGGGSVTVDLFGEGTYRATFGGMDGIGADFGYAQATAYGGGSAFCKVPAWNDMDVDVGCFDPAGTAVNAPFSVFLLKPGANADGLAYARADQPVAARYDADAMYAYNAGGGNVEITRSDVGRYAVRFVGLSGQGTHGGHVQATAYGTSSRYCKVVDWGAEDVDVACFEAAGAAVDARFAVLFLKPEGVNTAAEEADAPDEAVWVVNHPNPFFTEATITYRAARPGPVRLVVYDLLGRRVRTLVDAVMPAGTHAVTLEAGSLPAGVYVYELRTGTRAFTGTITRAR